MIFLLLVCVAALSIACVSLAAQVDPNAASLGLLSSAGLHLPEKPGAAAKGAVAAPPKSLPAKQASNPRRAAAPGIQPPGVLPLGIQPPGVLPPADPANSSAAAAPTAIPTLALPDPRRSAFPLPAGPADIIPAASPDPAATSPAAVRLDPFAADADITPAVRLVIPALALDASIRYMPFSGGSWQIAAGERQIAWLGETSWPGMGGNTALAAHYDFTDGSPGPFWSLKNLRPGDTVEVYTERSRYTYIVSLTQQVDPSDMSVVAPTEIARVTLITCSGWDPARRVFTRRLVVFADLTGVDLLQSQR